jgi:hypothetical protein
MARVFSKILAAAMIAPAAGIAAAGEAEQSWKGRISDSMCGVSHMTSDAPSGKAPTDGDCVRSCVKDGSTYVFVSGGKVFAIEDQAFPDLDENAGRDVTVYGKMKKDSIVISRIVSDRKVP